MSNETTTPAPGSDPLGDAMEKAMGALLYSTVSALVSAGMNPQAAFRVAAYVAIDGALGRDAVRSLGLPTSTERRWRAEVRKATDLGLLPDAPPPALVNELLGQMGLGGTYRVVPADQEAGR